MPAVIGRSIKEKEDTLIHTDRSHVILVTGKRGSGKSYTLGVMAEELHLKEKSVLPIILDPMGIYWTMALANDFPDIEEWGLLPEGFPVRLLVPGNPQRTYGEEVLEEMEYLGVNVRGITIPPGDIDPDEWLGLFDFSLTDPMGMALYRATSSLLEETVDTRYGIDEIKEEIISDDYSADRTKTALMSRLEVAKHWGIFGKGVWRTLDLFHKGVINVVDLSPLDPTRYGLRQFVTMVIAKKLFAERMKARRREEIGLITDVPKMWLLIDEAQQFIPTGSGTTSKPILIRWVKEGRQPGLSIALATQQPSALDSEVLSQCDTVIAHRITMKTDLNALNDLSQEYMRMEFKDYLKKVKEPGEALYFNDTSESLETVKIRGRMSRHGGRELVWK